MFKCGFVRCLVGGGVLLVFVLLVLVSFGSLTTDVFELDLPLDFFSLGELEGWKGGEGGEEGEEGVEGGEEVEEERLEDAEPGGIRVTIGDGNTEFGKVSRRENGGEFSICVVFVLSAVTT